MARGSVHRHLVAIAFCSLLACDDRESTPELGEAFDDATGERRPDASLAAAAIARVQAEAPPSYDLRREGTRFTATSGHLGRALAFTGDRTSLLADGREALALRTSGVGRGTVRVAPGDATIAARDNRITRTSAALAEWYTNGPLGLEQGFDLARAPEGDGELVIAIEVEGAARLALEHEGEIRIDAADGQRLRYGHLFASDADGEELPSWLAVDGEHIELHVDDTAAAYPIAIDPILEVWSAELVRDDSRPASMYGWAVAIAGDRAVVGAPWTASFGLASTGAVYQFQRSSQGWSDGIATYGPAQATCGVAVALAGDTVVVGCPGNAADAPGGSVRILEWADSHSSDFVMANDAAADDGFGSAVDFDGTTLVVGAPLDDRPGKTNAGAAYVFEYVDGAWAQRAKITASDAAANDHFGSSVAVSGSRIVVGAELDDNAKGNDAGAAYAFTKSGSVWTQEAKLVGSQTTAGSHFGQTGAISVADAFIGAPQDAADDSGAAYVFRRSNGTWSEVARLVASDHAAGDAFGGGVAIDGTSAVVSASSADGNGVADTGAAYTFTRTNGVWSEQAKLTASAGATGDHLLGVGISGNQVVAGAASFDGAMGPNSGRAFAFERTAGVWSEAGVLLASAKFGESGHYVAMQGDTVVIGDAYGDAHNPNLHVFDREGDAWVQTHARSADGATVSRGMSVALDGDTMANLQYVQSYGPQDGKIEITRRNHNEWTHEAWLLPPPDVTDEFSFGTSLALDGDTVVVAGSAWDGSSWNTLVCVYDRTGTQWTLTSCEPMDHDVWSLALVGDTLAIGQYCFELDGLSCAGAVAMRTRIDGVWTAGPQIVAPSPEVNAHFGGSLSMRADEMLVGSVHGAYVFVRDGDEWTLQATLMSSDAQAGDSFGSHVALGDDIALVGAPLHTWLTQADGAAYVFVRQAGVWSETRVLHPTIAEDHQYYGRGLAIDGSTAVVTGQHFPTYDYFVHVYDDVGS